MTTIVHGPPSPLGPQPDMEFDGYRLIERLGEGAMGQVWRAHDLTLDRHVAIKLILGTEKDSHARQRFRAEAQALGRIQHPNVVAVYRSGEALGQPYIAYELVAGQSLDAARACSSRSLARAQRSVLWRSSRSAGSRSDRRFPREP